MLFTYKIESRPPFGLTSEMLEYQTGGNPYRGMIYGMTGRQHPSCTFMWRFWDEFGIQDADWIGYWDPRCPVRTDQPGVLATVYRKPDKTLIALAHWPSDTPREKATARKLDTAPTLDGKLAPEEWDSAARLTNFTAFGQDRLAEDQTEAFVTWDPERLYVAFRCLAPGGKPKANVTQRDGAVWEDDAIELFLQPDPERPEYYQFVGNSAGVFYDTRGLSGKDWNGDFEYRTSVQDGYWEGELSVSFAALGMSAPREGQAMGLNICRDQVSPRGAQSCWSPMTGTFHNPERFGRLTFTATQPSTRQDANTLEASRRGPTVRLRIDWQALGLDPAKAKLTAPAIQNFQGPAQFSPTDEIPIEAGKGWLLVLGPA